MRRYIVKISLFVLALALTFSLVIPSVSAGEDPRTKYYDECVKWSLSDDNKTLTGDGKVYTVYDPPIMSEIVSEKLFMYYNYVTFSVPIDRVTTSVYIVASYKDGGDIVWIRDGFPMYVTESGRAHMDSFYNGDSREYFLSRSKDSQCDLTAELVAELEKAEGESVTFAVTALSKYAQYVVKARDTKGIVAYSLGSLFYINGEYYYVNHEKLENNQFDADGNISFRKGSIELIKLNSELVSAINASMSNMGYKHVSYEWEIDSKVDANNEDSDFEFMWYTFFCPIGGMVAGVLLPQSKKLGKPKRWYLVAALSAAILLLSVVFY